MALSVKYLKRLAGNFRLRQLPLEDLKPVSEGSARVHLTQPSHVNGEALPRAAKAASLQGTSLHPLARFLDQAGLILFGEGEEFNACFGDECQNTE